MYQLSLNYRDKDAHSRLRPHLFAEEYPCEERAAERLATFECVSFYLGGTKVAHLVTQK